MKSMKFLSALLAVLVLGLPASGSSDQNDERLDRLFATLKSSQDASEQQAAESTIWEIWFDSGNSEIDTKMETAGQLLQAGNLAAAEQIYSEIIEQLPGFSEGWNRRATVRYYQGDFAGSLSDIEDTLRLEPRHFGAIWGLGMILGSQRDYERAILAFERLLEIKPNSIDARPRIELLKRQMAQDSV